MRDLIVETDLGHDPDDFFTLCYLAAAGVRLRAITVVPGDRDQLAVARLLVKPLGLDIPVGASKPDSRSAAPAACTTTCCAASASRARPATTGRGDEVIAATLRQHPGCEFLVIGPCTSTARYLARPDADRARAGSPCRAASSATTCTRRASACRSSRARSGCRRSTSTATARGPRCCCRPPIAERRFVGKNVCHTLLYDRAFHASACRRPIPATRPRCCSWPGWTAYLRKHEEKKWHDPTAAACHLHPRDRHLGPRPGEQASRAAGARSPTASGDQILADIDREALWACFRNWQ